MKPGKGERAVQVLLAVLKSSCYLALFLGMQIAVMLPMAVIVGIQAAISGGTVDEDLTYQFLMDNSMIFSLISGVLTLMAVLIFYCVRRKRTSEALWLRRVPAPTLWVGAALAPGLYLVVTLVLAVLPESWMESYSEASAGLDTGGALGVLAVVLVAPVVEEFIFRGLIMTRLSRAMPGWLAIVLSAAIFGICHGNPVWFGYAFVLGVVFGLMDWKAGSILPSILGHVTFNGIGQMITFLPETESGAGEGIMLLTLLAVGIIAPIVDRKAVAALFRPASKPILRPIQTLPTAPAVYDFDPWYE